MNNERYKPTLNNVNLNSGWQGIDFSLSRDKQETTVYPAEDKLQNATINDDFIYLSTTDRQHECYMNGNLASNDEYTAFSGYFTSQATAENRINADGTFDSYGFHRDLCVSPTIHATESKELMDKRHLDCFYIDRDRMEQVYGTRDFNAAIGKCSANNHFGSDGGDQGYNVSLTELYNNGCLKYAGTYDADPASTLRFRGEYFQMSKFRKDKCSAVMSGKSAEDVQTIGFPLDQHCHENTKFSCTVYNDEKALSEHYKDFKPTYNEQLAKSTNPQDRMTSEMWSQLNSQDSAHTSQPQLSGELPPPQQSKTSNNNDIAGSLPEYKSVAPEHNNKIAGTTPDQEDSIDLSDRNLRNKAEPSLSEGLGNKTGNGINSTTGIT